MMEKSMGSMWGENWANFLSELAKGGKEMLLKDYFVPAHVPAEE